jgi:uracil-DNA glycosylase
MSLTRLLREIDVCQVCATCLPLGPRPVLSAAKSARLLIIGQAPGSKVHQSGVPWSDASGDRLRDWMGIDTSVFYDKTKVAIVPMGFCYPGASESGGDNPPRPECATLWHERLIKYLSRVELTLLVGQYAHRRYLGPKRKTSLTQTVRAFADYGPEFLPLPHPSWRSAIWVKKNPWFEQEIVPSLRKAIRGVI